MKLKIWLFVLSVISVDTTSAFGQTISICNDPFQYSGEFTDSESQLQYLNARYYNARITRFIQWDSYDLVNRYAYADGNPTMNEDPSGHLSSAIANGLDFLLPGLGDAINGQYKSAAIMFGAAVGTGLAIGGAAIFWSKLSTFSQSDFDSAEPLLTREDLPSASLFTLDYALRSEAQGGEILPKRIVRSTGNPVTDAYERAKANGNKISKSDFLATFDKAPAGRLTKWRGYGNGLSRVELMTYRKNLPEGLAPEGIENLNTLKNYLIREIRPEKNIMIEGDPRHNLLIYFKEVLDGYMADTRTVFRINVTPEWHNRGSLLDFNFNANGPHYDIRVETIGRGVVGHLAFD